MDNQPAKILKLINIILALLILMGTPPCSFSSHGVFFRYQVSGPGFRARGLRFRVQGSGFTVYDSVYAYGWALPL